LKTKFKFELPYPNRLLTRQGHLLDPTQHSGCYKHNRMFYHSIFTTPDTMPGLTAKYLRSAPKKNRMSGAHTRCDLDDDVRSISSDSSGTHDVTVPSTRRDFAEGPSQNSESSMRNRSFLWVGLKGRASWREASKYMTVFPK